jgi:hypothetical protein
MMNHKNEIPSCLQELMNEYGWTEKELREKIELLKGPPYDCMVFYRFQDNYGELVDLLITVFRHFEAAVEFHVSWDNSWRRADQYNGIYPNLNWVYRINPNWVIPTE